MNDIKDRIREEGMSNLDVKFPEAETIENKAGFVKKPTANNVLRSRVLPPLLGALGGAAIAIAIAIPVTLCLNQGNTLYGGETPFQQAYYGNYVFDYQSYISENFLSPIGEETIVVFAETIKKENGVVVVPSKGNFEGAFRFENTPLSAIEFNDPFIIDDYAIETTYVSEEGEIAMTVEAKRLNSYSTIRVRFYDEDDYSLLDVTFGLQQ